MHPKSLLTSSFLFGHFLAAEAVNPIFGAFATPSCEACLDDAFASCPGDYKTRTYAECMCAGIGGEGGYKMVSCVAGSCDFNINENKNAAISHATYCVGFFKEFCTKSENNLPQSVYERECLSSTTEPAGTSPTSTGRTASTSMTGGLPSSSALTSKMAAPSQTKSASFAAAAAVPAWVLAAGFCAQAIVIHV
ncbi:hypothetical protein IF1G_10460 [Cordyceps javanica]|uniref:Extracellular membrane protein CFEM domain-containing protein n=1 Tax=Cordyceps javanica TaxID=43265 RepID=A0A545UN99_9HYPO|nr:hypothetical protein IF1G_10460 [Cordyceps javanica]